MSADLDHNSNQLIEAYLDGRLSAAEREAFESRLEREPALRAEIELQRRIDRSLSSVSAMPDMSALLARVRKGPTPPAPRTKARFNQRPLLFRLLVEVGVAAAIGLVVGAGYLVWDAYHSTGQPGALLAHQTMCEFYREREKEDFRPDWVCPPPRFRHTFDYRLGQPLLLMEAPGVQMKGLAYSNTLSAKTVNIMAKVNGHGVVVYADLARGAPSADVCPGGGLRVFERRLGSLILYELTPLPEPHVLDLLYIPQDAPTQPAAP